VVLLLIKQYDLKASDSAKYGFYLAKHEATDYPAELFKDWYKDPCYLKMLVKKVLFYIGGMALGDYVMLNPTLTAFRNAFPSAEFSIVGCPSKVVQMLAQEAGVMDRLFWSKIKKHRPWLYKKYKELWDYGKVLGGIDLLVDTQRQFLPSLVLSLCFDYKYRIGYSSKCFFSDWKFEEPNRPKVHDTYQSLMLARRLGIKPLSPLHSIKIPEWVEGEVEALFRNIDSNKMIAMFPLVSFNDPCRQWPVNYWKKLTELLSDEGYEVILFGDPERIDILQEIKGKNRARVFWNLLNERQREYEIFFCIATLRKASCVIGLESGGSHLAAACGARTLTLAPATRLGRYAPLGNDSWVIYSNLLESKEELTTSERVEIINSLTPEVVLNAVGKIVS